MKLQWEKYKGMHFGLDGTRVVCGVAKPDNAPLEMFMVQFYDASFTTLEAAQEYAEQDYELLSKPPRSHFAESMIPILESTLSSLRGLGAKEPQ